MRSAAIAAAVLLGVVGVFQLALAAGAPWGSAAWGGGQRGVLPRRLRVAGGLAGVVVYPVIALYVLVSAGQIEAEWLPGAGRVAMWALTGFFALGAVANFASRSPIERIWGPVALGIAVCCGIVALG